MADPSHLFITRADIAHLACDAWLLPTSRSLDLVESWRSSLSEGELSLWDHVADRAATGFGRDYRVMPLDLDPEQRISRAWLTAIGARAGTPVEWYIDGVQEFLDRAEYWLHERPPLHGRERSLVALPLVGTGHGGAFAVKGTIVRSLVEYLMHEAADRPFDIALVTFDSAALAAVEAERKHLASERFPASWEPLSERAHAVASGLAARALRRELVLFIGAGVSAAAGLPTWRELLVGLAQDAGLTDDDRTDFDTMDSLDQARVLGMRLALEQRQLGEAVASRLQAEKYSLSHSLLASLPVHEVVTTNYDQLFEMASRDVGREAAVLPYAPDATRRRWLLKLHGCVSEPEDIVLTRTDYLRYTERRAALAGIVQALLITRHMLFVGFSLNDDNFHRIADEVRRAMGAPEDGHAREPFATALLLTQQRFLNQLWSPEIQCIAVPAGATSMASAARSLEIFLDLVCSMTTDHTSHLFDDTYDAVLLPGERELRDKLRDLRANLSSAAKRTLAWHELDDLLSQWAN